MRGESTGKGGEGVMLSVRILSFIYVCEDLLGFLVILNDGKKEEKFKR